MPLARRIVAAVEEVTTGDAATVSLALAAAATALKLAGHPEEADGAYADLVARSDSVEDADVQLRAAIAELRRAQFALSRADEDAAGRGFRSAWDRCERARRRGTGEAVPVLVQLEAATALATLALGAGDHDAALGWLRAALAAASVPPPNPADWNLLAATLRVGHLAWANVGPGPAELLFAGVAAFATADGDVRTSARAWESLAGLYREAGDEARAYEAYRRAAVALGAGELGEDLALMKAGLLNDAGLAADRLREYAIAARLYADALDIRTKLLPPNHLDVVLSRYNVAELARITGDVDFAATELRMVVDALRGDPGPEDGWLLVTAMKNLARAEQTLGRAGEAERWSAEALRLPGVDPKQRVDLLIALASARRHQGRPVEVEADLDRAVADLGNAEGEDSTAYLAALGSLAGFLPRSEANRIEEYYERVVAGLGDRQPDTRGPSLVNLAVVRWMGGDHDGAFDAFRRARPLWEEAVAERWRVRSAFDTDFDEPWPFRVGALQFVARHRADDPDSLAFAFRVGVASKRLQAEALVRQQDLVLEGRDDLVELHDLAAQLRRAAAWEDASDEELDEVEAMLAFQVPRTVLLRSFEDSEPATVAASLPPGTVLVEYVRCAAIHAEGGPLGYEQPSYLSFVLPAGQAGGLQLFDLGDAEKIDELATELTASIGGSGRDLGPALDDGVETDWRVPARALAALIIDPLAAALPELATVLLAPTGPLCAVPFDALLDRSGRPLLHTRTLGILGSARDARRVTYRPNWATGEPLVISAPQYGPPAAPFGPLPGAGSEGRTVARLLKVQPVSGKNATREVVLSARNPEILHLATHGFYLAQQTDTDNAERFPRLASHPLLRSGVALAGANRSVFGSGTEPSAGVVTALDALGLQLYGTDLVVLSACETGVGPVDLAEGTLGLARSFLLGGARSVVWSLWKVDDASTASLMKAFYSRLLKEMPRAEALRKSKYDLYNEFPDRPDLWAAFALQGDPDPLMRFRSLLVPSQQIPNNTVEGEGNTFLLDTGGRPFAGFEVSVGGEPLSIASVSGRNLPLAFAEDQRAAAVAAFRAGKAEEAERLMTEALDGLKGAKVGRPLAANMKAAMVIITAAQGKYQQARRYGLQAVREHERLELPEHELAAVLDNLAVAEANLGKIDHAVTHATRALRLKEELYPEGHRQREFTVDLLRQLGEDTTGGGT